MPPSRRKEITDAQHARLAPLIDEAITTLKSAGKEQLADAVAELARSMPGWGGRGTMIRTAVRIDTALLARIREKFPSQPLNDLAREGVRLFLDGQLEIHHIARGGTKDPVSIRMPDELLQQLNARCDEMNKSGELGFRVTPTVVLVSHLEALAPAPQD